MVARQVEGLNPQPPQKFKVADFLKWVEGQVDKGFEVISCYEAGPTGYWLHRKLTGLGVTNYVVCPTRLDSRGKGVNTDKTDALELLVRLDRYVAGNRKAFSVVRGADAEPGAEAGLEPAAGAIAAAAAELGGPRADVAVGSRVSGGQPLVERGAMGAVAGAVAGVAGEPIGVFSAGD